MPEGPAKEAARAELDEGFASRLFAGKNPKRDSTVALADAKGRVRLRLAVSLEGNAAIEFLDESGAVTKRIDSAVVGEH